MIGVSIKLEKQNNFLFAAMAGYECANEDEECKCSGKVSYGIYLDSGRVYPDIVFGSQSEKKHVERSINCTKENFSDYPEEESYPFMKRCWCYPSSNQLFSLLWKIHFDYLNSLV